MEQAGLRHNDIAAFSGVTRATFKILVTCYRLHGTVTIFIVLTDLALQRQDKAHAYPGATPT